MAEHQLDDADVDAIRQEPARGFVPEVVPAEIDPLELFAIPRGTPGPASVVFVISIRMNSRQHRRSCSIGFKRSNNWSRGLSSFEVGGTMDQQRRQSPRRLSEAECLQINLDGRALEKAGRMEEAIAKYEYGVARMTDTPATFDRLLVLYHTAHRLQDERRICQAAAKRFGSSDYRSRLVRIDSEIERRRGV